MAFPSGRVKEEAGAGRERDGRKRRDARLEYQLRRDYGAQISGGVGPGKDEPGLVDWVRTGTSERRETCPPFSARLLVDPMKINSPRPRAGQCGQRFRRVIIPLPFSPPDRPLDQHLATHHGKNKVSSKYFWPLAILPHLLYKMGSIRLHQLAGSISLITSPGGFLLPFEQPAG